MPETGALASKRILLVEDNQGLRQGLARLLKERGYAVTEAHDGKEAVRQVQEHPCAYFDVIVTDYSLDADMTGGEAVNLVRQLCPEERVIFMSGHELPHDLRRGEVFLRKPVSGEELEEAIERLMFRTAETEPPEAP